MGLIKWSPCSDCELRHTIRDEPPYDICVANPTGDFECFRVQAAEELSVAATEFARIIAGQIRLVPEKSRKELAASVADAIDSALYELGAGSDFGQFMTLCGFPNPQQEVTP